MSQNDAPSDGLNDFTEFILMSVQWESCTRRSTTNWPSTSIGCVISRTDQTQQPRSVQGDGSGHARGEFYADSLKDVLPGGQKSSQTSHHSR